LRAMDGVDEHSTRTVYPLGVGALLAGAVCLLLLCTRTSVLQQLRNRRSPSTERSSSPPPQGSPERRTRSPPRAPSTGGSLRRRSVPELSAEDAEAMRKYPASLRKAAEGRGGSNLPAVVVRNMLLPTAERADFRLRFGEPFEESFFRAHVAALECATGHTTWFEWLGADETHADLCRALCAECLADAPPEEHAQGVLMFRTWLLNGRRDGFKALRRDVSELVQTSDGRALTLKEMQKREADAYEHRYSKDALLTSFLRTAMPAMRDDGVIAEQSKGRICPVCRDTYDPTAPDEQVRLVAFLPCGHWVCHGCFAEANAAAHKTRPYPYCPQCNVESLPMERDWPGVMVRQMA